MNREITRKAKIWCLAVFLFAAHIFCRTVAHADEGSAWNMMVSRTGDCKIDFPSRPQMVQQSLKVSEEGLRLHYDVYLAPLEDKGICLLLIAQYPLPINPGNEVAGLEGLLHGIVGHGAENELVFAKLIDVNGVPAVNFLVQNGLSYFRGLALMVGNKLYLIAMEGKKGTLDESVFTQFSESFKLHE